MEGRSKPRPREGFLDTIRAIATIRVVFWHAFGTPILSYLVASMPTMFFVAGSLFAASLDRKSFRVVVRDRLRRILIPFWVFGAVTLTALAASRVALGGARTAVNASGIVGWMFPIVDPKGNEWEAGWLSNPLWYLRALIWLMLITPLLRVMLRKFGNWFFCVPVGAVFVIDLLIRRPAVPLPGFATWRWYVGDLALYSVFWMLGFLHRAGRFAGMTKRAKQEWLAIAAMCAVLWCTTQPIIGGVVNNSYPAHLFVGGAWLFVFLLAEPILQGVPQRRFVGSAVRWLTRRSLTVYLWHTTAIVIADAILGKLVPGLPRLAILPFVAVLIPLATVLFGWVEDFAAGRPPKLWPLPFSLNALPRVIIRIVQIVVVVPGGVLARMRGGRLGLAGVRFGRRVNARQAASVGAGWLAAMSLINLVPAVSSAATSAGAGSAEAGSYATAASSESTRRAPAPSARPETAVFALTDAGDSGSATATTTVAARPVPTVATGATMANPSIAPTTVSSALSGSAVDSATSAALQSVVDTWRTELGVEGVTVSVIKADGAQWVGASGTLAADQVMEVTSVTKSFTAALILRLADKGAVSLDAPLPVLNAVPTFPKNVGITPRQLLRHTSGLATYQDSPEYLANPGMKLTPAAAVSLAAAQPLLWKPGSNSGYSSSGYLTLGLLAEQVTGKTLSQLFQDEFFTPLGLKSMALDALPAVDGWIGWSTGGITATMGDLTKWGAVLLKDRTVLSADSTAAMMDVSNDWSVGLGLWPVCPCSLGADGKKVFTSIGHNGGSGTYQFAPLDDSVIGAFLTEPIFNSRVTQQDLYELLARMRASLSAAIAPG